MATLPARTAAPVVVAAPSAKAAAQGSVARLTDQDACTGCGLCTDLCPRSAIRLAPLPQVDPGLCTGCGECIDACPGSALTLVAV